MPLAITQNEVNLSEHSYADVLGETYEYPSKYKSLIQPGEQIVYYRGKRRISGGDVTPSYLGVALVSDVQLAGDLWRCSITDFRPFDPPLPFKTADHYLEPAANSAEYKGLYFQDAVRLLDQTAFDAICESGLGSNARGDNDEPTVSPNAAAAYANPTLVEEVDELAMQLAMSEAEGRWPSSMVIRMPHNNPGFDIEVRHIDGDINFVEVKGTQAPTPKFFTSAGEVAFSKSRAENYSIWIFHTMNLKQRTATLVDFNGAVEESVFDLQPVQYRGVPLTTPSGKKVGSN